MNYNIPSDFNGIKLHPHRYRTVISTHQPIFNNRTTTSLTEDRLLLTILPGGIRPQHSPKVIILDLVLILVYKKPPLLFPILTFHFILVDGSFEIEVWEFFLEVFEDFVVEFREA